MALGVAERVQRLTDAEGLAGDGCEMVLDLIERYGRGGVVTLPDLVRLAASFEQIYELVAAASSGFANPNQEPAVRMEW